MSKLEGQDEILAIHRRKMNFSEGEKNLLLRLVEQHKDIIEQRSNEKDIVRCKEQVWNSISLSFNANEMVATPRTPHELKKLLQNLKAKAKKELSNKGDVVTNGPDINTLCKLTLGVNGTNQDTLSDVQVKQEPIDDNIDDEVDIPSDKATNEYAQWENSMDTTESINQKEPNRLQHTRDTDTNQSPGLVSSTPLNTRAKPTLSSAPFTIGTVSGITQSQKPTHISSPYRSTIDNGSMETQKHHNGIYHYKSKFSFPNKKRYNPIVPIVSSTERKQYLLQQEEHAAKMRLLELQMDIATEEHHATMQLINKQTEMYDLRCQLLRAQLEQSVPNLTISKSSKGQSHVFEEEVL